MKYPAILETVLSEQRLSTYYKMFPDDRGKAIDYYQLNIEISQSFYPLLSIVEIALRNSIHQSFSKHFKTDNWFQHCTQPRLADKIRVAVKKVGIEGEIFIPDKLVAELTFGFWSSIFNRVDAKHFWKPLQYVFPNIEQGVKRDKLALKVDHIRKFRNRIFHYEPICNDLIILMKNYHNILDVLIWMDADMAAWTSNFSSFKELYNKAKRMRS